MNYQQKLLYIIYIVIAEIEYLKKKKPQYTKKNVNQRSIWQEEPVENGKNSI